MIHYKKELFQVGNLIRKESTSILKKCETIIRSALNEERFSLLENEAKQICNLHHIPTPKSYITKTPEEAVERANEIGFPVVLKIVSPHILHKSDIGGVALDIKDKKQLVKTFKKLITKINRKKASVKVIGFLLEKMMPPSTELIIGGIRDDQFGPSVMLGMGGIFTEIYEDVTFRVAPISKMNALRMIHELKGSRILKGIRGKPPADLKSIVNLLINVSELIWSHDTINQLDLNPVIVYQNDVCAVDARIILKQAKERDA